MHFLHNVPGLGLQGETRPAIPHALRLKRGARCAERGAPGGFCGPGLAIAPHSAIGKIN